LDNKCYIKMDLFDYFSFRAELDCSDKVFWAGKSSIFL